MANEINIQENEEAGKANESETGDDYIVKSIGGFGIWQAIIIFMVAITRLIPVWNIETILFLTPPTKYFCTNFKNNVTVANVKMSTCYEDCEKYEYYQDVFEETLISEYGLICGDAWMASFVQTILMFGSLVGVFSFGWISDRFGRKKALTISGLLSIVFMFIAPFSNSYWMLIGLRFFIGFASNGIIAVSTVLIQEMVGPKFRYEIGCIALMPDGIAESLLALFAYYTSTWNQYLLLYTVVSVPILVMMLFIPETPRWMMATGKYDKTVELMTKAAKMNKLQVEGIKEVIYKSRDNMKAIKQPQDKMTYLDLFRSKKMALMTISSVIVWFISGITFFGLKQYLTMIGTDIYVVVTILGAMQLAACPIAVLLSQFCGRKTTLLMCLVTVGVTMGALIFVAKGTWTSTAVGIVGVTGCNTGFVIVYIYVSELYPTTMRNMGFSLSSTASKLGAMIAPFVANLNPQWMGALIFALLPVVAIVFSCFLPETKGKQLRDSVE